jgi:hypothetical protein
VAVRLNLKLELTYARETVLHFFDQVRKAFPQMSALHRHEDEALMLDEGRDRESYRWLRLEKECIRFGHFNPESMDEVHRLAEFILEHAPYHLSISEIDLDSLEVTYGFDLEYDGNHDEIVADALLSDHPLGGLLDAGVAPIEFQPNFGITLDSDCSEQAYFEVKARTSAYSVRTGEFDKEPLSIYVIVRKYWGYGPIDGLQTQYTKLSATTEELADAKAIELLLNPLAKAIASRR